MPEQYPELRGMRGGPKQKWLRDHRAEVLAYFEAHGEEATRAKYRITKDQTWCHLLNLRDINPAKFTKADKAIARAEITEAGLREVRREVRELKDQYGRFVPLLADQIKEKFFVPLLTGKIELPPELEKKPAPDPLDLADFRGKSGK